MRKQSNLSARGLWCVCGRRRCRWCWRQVVDHHLDLRRIALSHFDGREVALKLVGATVLTSRSNCTTPFFALTWLSFSAASFSARSQSELERMPAKTGSVET